VGELTKKSELRSIFSYILIFETLKHTKTVALDSCPWCVVNVTHKKNYLKVTVTATPL